MSLSFKRKKNIEEKKRKKIETLMKYLVNWSSLMYIHIYVFFYYPFIILFVYNNIFL